MKALRKWLQERKENKRWRLFINSIDFPKNPSHRQVHIHEHGDYTYFFDYDDGKWRLTGQSVAIQSSHNPFKIEKFEFITPKTSINCKKHTKNGLS